VRQEKLKAFDRATRLEEGSWGLRIKLYIWDRWWTYLLHFTAFTTWNVRVFWLDVEGMLMKGLVRL